MNANAIKMKKIIPWKFIYVNGFIDYCYTTPFILDVNIIIVLDLKVNIFFSENLSLQPKDFVIFVHMSVSMVFHSFLHFPIWISWYHLSSSCSFVWAVSSIRHSVLASFILLVLVMTYTTDFNRLYLSRLAISSVQPYIARPFFFLRFDITHITAKPLANFSVVGYSSVSLLSAA